MNRKVLFILAVCALTVLSGCGKASEETSSIPETVPVAETALTTEAPTEQITETEPETESVSETEEFILETDSPITQQEVIQAMQELIHEEGYTAEFIYDEKEQRYLFTIWEEGFGKTLDLIESFDPEWETFCNDFLNLYTHYVNALHELGDETSFTLKIVDERNHDTDLLVVQDGEIIYDIMQEKAFSSEQDTIIVDDVAFSKQSIIDELNKTFTESGRNAEAVYDESQNAYSISLWYEGLGQRTDSGDADRANWESQKTLFITTYDSVKNILALLDPDTPFILRVVDDRNHEVNLLTIQNGEITYDILAE